MTDTNNITGNWILTEDQLPPFGADIECTDEIDLPEIEIDTGMVYLESRVCMMAGIAGGHGYFGEGFATNGEGGTDYGLICDSPKYWRLAQSK